MVVILFGSTTKLLVNSKARSKSFNLFELTNVYKKNSILCFKIFKSNRCNRHSNTRRKDV